jgi:glycolate oxidase FAD binding subunit
MTPADAGDRIDGVAARFRAAPESAAELASVLSHAGSEGLAVIPRGGGSKLSWGMPPERADVVLETRRLDRVLEHAASDLVVSAEAGVRLSDLQGQLAAAGQRLSLDPPEADATLGGIVAAAASGPRRHRFGAPRDLLLGVTVALADGTLAKAGGKVVKNVAGYDLGKLFAGSLGTLGVIVAATFRLHPLPAARSLVVASLDSPDAAAQAVQAVLQSTLVPSAVELLWTGSGQVRLAVLFEGRAPGVAEQAATASGLLAAKGSARVVGDDDRDREWRSFVETEPADLRLQLAVLPADLAHALNAVRAAAEERRLSFTVSGRAGLGVLQAAFRGGDAESHAGVVAALRAGLPPRGGSVAIRHAAPEVKRRAGVFGDVGASLPLMRRVKERFDPGRTLSPGRFVGGI